MGLRPSRRRRSSQQPGGVDHISDLPDDLLLLILAGLGSTAAAARTSGLSRRWRGLWASLGDISLRDVAFESLAAVLSLVARPPRPIISLLEIRVPRQNRRVPREHWPVREDVASLVRAAARLAPEKIVLTLPRKGSNPNPADLHLPYFRRAVSIELESIPFVLRAPATTAAGGEEFAALQTLRLVDCIILDKDLDVLLSRSPRLRVLELRHKMTTWRGFHRQRTVHSATLQELVVDSEKAWLSRIDVVAPMLKQLTLSFWAYKEASISVSAPMVEKLSWSCWYADKAIGFGLWSLYMLRLDTAETPGQLPSLQICACTSSHTFSSENANLAKEIEKHTTVVEFSDLELHLTTMGHVFGSLVLHLLQMKRIRSVLRKLKIVRQSSQGEEEEACPANCPCEPREDWRTQIISLTALEEVHIYGFQGEDHEYDLLKLILSCAPMLRRMTVKLSHELSSSNDDVCTKIYDLAAYSSSVECLVYLGADAP